MAAVTPLSAKNAVVRLNGAVLVGSEWDVEPECTWADCSHFDGAGYELQQACLLKCGVRISGWWDGANNIHDAPISLQAGVTLSNVRCYVNTVSGPYWYFALLSVLGTPMTTRVSDVIKYSLRGKAQGVFVYPTGAAV